MCPSRHRSRRAADLRKAPEQLRPQIWRDPGNGAHLHGGMLVMHERGSRLVAICAACRSSDDPPWLRSVAACHERSEPLFRAMVEQARGHEREAAPPDRFFGCEEQDMMPGRCTAPALGWSRAASS